MVLARANKKVETKDFRSTTAGSPELSTRKSAADKKATALAMQRAKAPYIMRKSGTCRIMVMQRASRDSIEHRAR